MLRDRSSDSPTPAPYSTRNLVTDYLQSDVCCTLFDSCPGNLGHPISGYKAFLAQRPPLLVRLGVDAAIIAALSGTVALLLRASAHAPLSGVLSAIARVLPSPTLAQAATIALALAVRASLQM